MLVIYSNRILSDPVQIDEGVFSNTGELTIASNSIVMTFLFVVAISVSLVLLLGFFRDLKIEYRSFYFLQYIAIALMIILTYLNISNQLTDTTRRVNGEHVVNFTTDEGTETLILRPDFSNLYYILLMIIIVWTFISPILLFGRENEPSPKSSGKQIISDEIKDKYGDQKCLVCNKNVLSSRLTLTKTTCNKLSHYSHLTRKIGKTKICPGCSVPLTKNKLNRISHSSL